VGEVIITFPPEMKETARSLAVVVWKEMPRHIATLERLRGLYEDQEGLSRRICDLLGVPEEQAFIKEYLEHSRFIVEITYRLLTRIRLCRPEELDRVLAEITSRTGGAFRMDGQTLSFGMSEGGPGTQPNLEAVQAPIPIERQEELDDRAVARMFSNRFADLSKGVLFAPIHEAVESLLIIRMSLHHPFTRWFNDGLANWVALTISRRLLPDVTREWEEDLLSDRSTVGGRVNLWTWAQNDAALPPDPTDKRASEASAAHYRHATQVFEKLFGDMPDTALSSTIKMLRGTQYPDTETMCGVLQRATGRNARAILMDHVPPRLKGGIASLAVGTLQSETQEKLKNASILSVEGQVHQALELDPNHAVGWLLAAWAARKRGMDPALVDAYVGRAAWLVNTPNGRRSFPEYQDSAWQFVLWKLAVRAGATDVAASLFARVTATPGPEERDARAAMKELKKAREAAPAPAPAVP
jgi:hypothetical protein